MPEIDGQIQPVPLQRSLVIALGGSGAEVMMRLRRLLVDRFGRMEDIPLVKFLYIDTDLTWWNQIGSKVEATIRLSDAERFDAQVPDTTGLYENIANGDAGHFDWFSLEDLKNFTSITSGAGAIRQLGRFALATHAAKIKKDKIVPLLQQLKADKTATTMNSQYGIQVAQGINVHIIAGLAGGTGSGMYLDVAYLLRDIVREQAIQGVNQFIGYLMLPQSFEGLDSTNPMPNGYAALKELNYYSYIHSPSNALASLYGIPTWDVNYTGTESGRVHFESTPPFDFCYLLDSSNEHVNLERSNIFAMVAQSLFHEFTLSFATFKRSLRANIKKGITKNDARDCPVGFMSFGQSLVFFPRTEVEKLLGYQLALRAAQQWIDKTAAPIEVYAQKSERPDADKTVEETLRSVNSQADDEALKNAVRSFIQRDLKDTVGLGRDALLNSVLTEHNLRLTDKPAALQEEIKAQWIAEKWSTDAFIGHSSNAWQRWKTDFNDDHADPNQWGQYMRLLDANRNNANKKLRQALEQALFAAFEDTQKYGPAWSVCMARQLRSYLTGLKNEYMKVANDASAIAELLGNLVLINAVAGGTGMSLSAIIEKRIGDEFKQLDQAVQSMNPFRKKEHVERQAYEYLTWCGFWCRARAEERARRLAAAIMDSLISSLEDVERRLLDRAATLARLKAELLSTAREWSQKAGKTETIGTLLYNPALLKALETTVQKRQGDIYNPTLVAANALKRLGKPLSELGQDDLPTLMALLLSEAQAAAGSLDEQALQDTQFAAYDLLAAEYQDDTALEEALRTTVAQGAPFVQLAAATPGGGWSTNDLKQARIAGLRGGVVENDQDKERVRVIEMLSRVGWDVGNNVRAIEDSSQIVFFQEIGGFPLRALQNIREMREAYEEHQRINKGTPLHIMRDEMASIYPDILPPDMKALERARLAHLVGICIGLMTERDFDNGKGGTVRKVALVTTNPQTGKPKVMPIGLNADSAIMTLLNDPGLLSGVEREIEARIGAAEDKERQALAKRLVAHLGDVETEVKLTLPAGVDAITNERYQKEDERITQFMQKYNLKLDP